MPGEPIDDSTGRSSPVRGVSSPISGYQQVVNQTPHVLAINAVVRTTGARVYYEVRGEGPGVLLAGCPMDATAFAPLADLLDRSS